MKRSTTSFSDLHGSPESAGRFTVLLGDEADAAEAWHQTARGLLAAQGVRTLVARTGREALGLIEDSALGRGPRIHVAVLDQHMPMMGGLQILRRLQRELREAQERNLEHLHSAGGMPAPPVAPASGAPSPPAGPRAPAVPGTATTPAPPAVPPAILLADSLAGALMHEALTVQVFSVLPRPVELNLLLDTLARAVRRYYQNRWPERPGE